MLDHFSALPPEVIINKVLPEMNNLPALSSLNRVSLFFRKATKNILEKAKKEFYDNPVIKQINILGIEIEKLQESYFSRYKHEEEIALKNQKLMLLNMIKKELGHMNNKKDFEEYFDKNIFKISYSPVVIMEKIMGGKTGEALQLIYNALPNAKAQQGFYGPQIEYEKAKVKIEEIEDERALLANI